MASDLRRRASPPAHWRSPSSVHVSATAVRSGRAAIFSGDSLTLDAVLASACLPALFPPVVIEGEPYWDGGFSVNPPLAPFLHGGGPRLWGHLPVLSALAFTAALVLSWRLVRAISRSGHL